MPSEYLATIRGISIDIPATLNKFTGQSKSNYTRKEFENYLKKIGLTHNFGNLDPGFENPINDGFVVSVEYDGFDIDLAVGYLSTGSWHYQSWAASEWSKRDLEQQRNFLDPKNLSESIEKNLREKWSDRLVLKGGFSIRTEECEGINNFMPNKQKVQSGGSNDGSKDGSDINYHAKYLKYKKKYLDLKSKKYRL
ncbi:hypothetical protein QJ850_gp907 [Acanthamoeba polyphaga mimivirus]|uniref:Uncharacterized protein n=1 Tax=Acanthamoeba polyphaga mimivirus Kroon TaxID=3069720 RepID=A0A0G2Y7J6_9VIRU|nr:hypothetical protein QJ850_gp907 [Acanthamoeba polyphaga mimivirus]AKI79792.1 hypothetical protein [Acanthamoeba polyphaga mimivirus Kroon]